jgi:hypothetical protein
MVTPGPGVSSVPAMLKSGPRLVLAGMIVPAGVVRSSSMKTARELGIGAAELGDVADVEILVDRHADIVAGEDLCDDGETGAIGVARSDQRIAGGDEGAVER